MGGVAMEPDTAFLFTEEAGMQEICYFMEEHASCFLKAHVCKAIPE